MGQALKWNTNGYSNIQKSPLYTIRSGAFGDGSFLSQASTGSLWSNTNKSATDAYYLDYNSSNIYTANKYYRQVGFPVRCIARRFSVITKKKNQDMRLFFFSSWFLSLGLSFPKESPITFNFLLVQYGIAVKYVGSGGATWSNNGYSNIQNNPLYIPQSGNFADDSFNYQASGGYLWSGTTNSGTNAYDLNYNSSGVLPANYGNRQYGFPVRRIA